MSSGTDCDDTDLIGEDADGDGYPSCGGDCDDNDDTVFPVDQDGDGYSNVMGTATMIK